MGIVANSSGGHAIPRNLPRASSLGNFQSKWSKQMPLYEPAENPRTKTFRWVRACGRVLRYRVLPAPMRRSIEGSGPAEMQESSMRRSNMRFLKHLNSHKSPCVSIHPSGGWQSSFQKLVPSSSTVNSKVMEGEELMHGFSKTKRNHVPCPFHRVVQFHFRCG